MTEACEGGVMTRFWGRLRSKSSTEATALEIIRILAEKVNSPSQRQNPTPHHYQQDIKWPPQPPRTGPILIDPRLLTAASYMWERFVKAGDPDERMALTQSCIELYNLLSAEQEEFRKDFFEDRKDSTKKWLRILRAFLAIGQLVYIRCSKPAFEGVLLRTSYDVTRDELRLEAYGEDKEFDEALPIHWDDLRIEVIGDRKTPEQIFDSNNTRFSNSIAINTSGEMEDNNDDVKTVVDAFPGREAGGENI